MDPQLRSAIEIVEEEYVRQKLHVDASVNGFQRAAQLCMLAGYARSIALMYRTGCEYNTAEIWFSRSVSHAGDAVKDIKREVVR
jgi:hypothetical protein